MADDGFPRPASKIVATMADLFRQPNLGPGPSRVPEMKAIKEGS
jgi:hypothetical protein